MKSYFLYNFLIFLFKCFGGLRKLLHNALPHSFLSFSKTWWELSSILTLFCPWDMVLGETFYQNFSSTRNCNLVKFILSDGVSNMLGRPNSESYSCNAFSWLFQDSWILSQSKTICSKSKLNSWFLLSLCYNSNSCAYLSKWHNFTKDNLELEWPFRGTSTWAKLFSREVP